MKEIGRRLRKLSSEKGVSKREIAEAINCTEEQVEKWFNGDAAALFWQIETVADMLGTTVEALID